MKTPSPRIQAQKARWTRSSFQKMRPTIAWLIRTPTQVASQGGQLAWRVRHRLALHVSDENLLERRPANFDTANVFCNAEAVELRFVHIPHEQPPLSPFEFAMQH